MDLPNPAFGESRICFFQPWRTGVIVHAALSLVYGVPCYPFTTHVVNANPFAQDVSAFPVIVYSARNRGVVRAAGVPSILENIVQDATSYFLVMLTGHLLLVIFELLAPVSVYSVCLVSTHGELRAGADPAPSLVVNLYFKRRDKDKFAELLLRP